MLIVFCFEPVHTQFRSANIDQLEKGANESVEIGMSIGLMGIVGMNGDDEVGMMLGLVEILDICSRKVVGSGS